MVRAEQVTDAVAFHAEGPVWSGRWGGLRWVDMLAGDVLSLRADGGVDRHHVAEVAAAIRPRRGGGMVVGIERGFALIDGDGSQSRLPELWDDAGVRMNEGGCDPDGRFYCGSMAYDKSKGAGALYRLHPDGTTSVVLRDVTISNGLEWSPDGSLAYYNDTGTGRTDVFDYDPAGGLTKRRAFVVHAEDGRPDGLTVDSAGGVWVAMANAGEVRRYSPAGLLEDVVGLPVPKVTACTFGGEDLDRLFVTTSREGVDAAAYPAAGALFVASVDATGLPVREFAG